MNVGRRNNADEARTFMLVSVLSFIAAVSSVMIPNYGLYISLALVVFGGFTMLISGTIRERVNGGKQSTLTDESTSSYEDKEEQLIL